MLAELEAHAGRLVRTAADEELDSAAILEVEERLEDLESPLARFVHLLHPWVAFGIMPLFALANSGVDLRALEPAQLTGRLAVGTAVALLFGKQLGIFVFTWVAVRAGAAPMPGGASVAKLLGVSTVAGIGFTVALFIAGLAYPAIPGSARRGEGRDPRRIARVRYRRSRDAAVHPGDRRIALGRAGCDASRGRDRSRLRGATRVDAALTGSRPRARR